MVVTVKAYPSISTKYDEAVCVAGLRTDEYNTLSPFVRLYPVQFRDLPAARQFKKWDVIEVDVAPHQSDLRPESYRPVPESIEIVGHLDTNDNWAKRRAVLARAGAPMTMCGLRAEQSLQGTSLGIVRPRRVRALKIDERDPEEMAESTAKLSRDADLLKWTEISRLEPSPLEFRYQFDCFDPDCNEHSMSIIDWEIHAALRKWRGSYPDAETLLAKIRQRWLDDICGPDKDTLFFVGNMHQYPASFLVLGAFYPRKG